MRILVVHGAGQVCKRLVDFLSKIPDVEIMTRDTCADAWSGEVAAFQPDLVIIDVRLAPKNGLEALRLLKDSEHMPLVIMTSELPYRQYKRRCLRDGADYFFYFPEEIDNMRSTIHALMGNAEGRLEASEMHNSRRRILHLHADHTGRQPDA